MTSVYRGKFGNIIVREEGPCRNLYFDDVLQGGIRLDDPSVCTAPVMEAFHLITRMRPVPSKVLIIGLGAGEVPRAFLRAYPRTHIRVVEIDPQVVAVARHHFALPMDSQLDVVVTDGFDYLQSSQESFDLIVLDAWEPNGLPPQFRGVSFLELASKRLNPDGMLAANVIGTLVGDESWLIKRFQSDAAQVFSERYRFQIGQFSPDVVQNVVFFLGKGASTAVQREGIPSDFELVELHEKSSDPT